MVSPQSLFFSFFFSQSGKAPSRQEEPQLPMAFPGSCESSWSALGCHLSLHQDGRDGRDDPYRQQRRRDRDDRDARHDRDPWMRLVFFCSFDTNRKLDLHQHLICKECLFWLPGALNASKEKAARNVSAAGKKARDWDALCVCVCVCVCVRMRVRVRANLSEF